MTVPVVALLVAAAFVIAPKLAPLQPNAQASPTVDPLAVPAVGVCYDVAANNQFNTGAETEPKVPCDEGHRLETISSGRIPGADPAEWPKETDDLTYELFATCEEQAERFLGAHWSTTYTMLVLSIPSLAAWRSGAHWYRCDLGATDEMWGTPIKTTGGLREAAEPITCVTWATTTDGGVSNVEGADCDDRHQGEVAGAYRMSRVGDAEWESEEMFQSLSDGCWPIVLEYLDSDELHEELSFWYFYPRAADSLDQSIVCIISAADDREFTDSVEGLGDAAIPFA